jgi:hypothetical protein
VQQKPRKAVDIEEIRRKNINYWADKLGRNILAEKIGYKDTVYINQLCAGHGSFGSRTARKIEKALELDKGWFDVLHGEDAAGTSFARPLILKIASETNDFTQAEFAELLLQIEIIKRRKRGDF